MEVVDFYPKTFQEIPKQDNPAYGSDECVLLVKDYGTCPHTNVLYIKPDPVESVNHVAKFWRHDRALEYAKMFKP